jgi:hypothetical protein
LIRRVVVSILAAAAIACGSSNNNGGGANGVSVGTGPYAGTYTNGAGLTASGTCSAGGTTLTGAALSLGVSSSNANLCQALTQGAEPANATAITVTVAKVNVFGQAQTITPGTYSVLDLSGGATPIPDPNGSVAIAFVSAAKNGTAAGVGQGCTITSEEEAGSGTVTITSVTAARAAGTVSATLKNNGGVVNGAFDVPLCSGAFTLGGSCTITGVPQATSCQ